MNGPSSNPPTGGIAARTPGVSRANGANLGSPNKLEGLNPEQRGAVLKTEGGDFSKAVRSLRNAILGKSVVNPRMSDVHP